MVFNVMLSYSWNNSAERAALAHQLRMIRGVNVLFDKKHVGIGAAVHRNLSGLLSKADCIVALLTKPAVGSKEVLDELTRAHERGKHIIPIVAEDVAIDSLPWFVRDLNFIKYAERDFDTILVGVETTVRQLLSKNRRRAGKRAVADQGKVKVVVRKPVRSTSPVRSTEQVAIPNASPRSSRPRSAAQIAEVGNRTFFDMRNDRMRLEKREVARYVVENYLREGDSIILDAGSSIYPIAEVIAEKARLEPQRTHFAIMTHNYAAIEVLARVPREANLNIVSSGGRYDWDLNAYFGNQTVNAYADFFPRVVILGVSGLRAEIGLFCHGNTEEPAVKTFIFRKQTRDRIILADYTKIGFQDGFRFGESNALRDGARRCIVVTTSPPQGANVEDRDLFEREIELLKMYGVDVIVIEGADAR